MANKPVSLRPSDFVEGGAVPVDRILTWKECRFNLFDYTRKSGEVVATTVAARINYVDEDGQEFEQQYSAGDPARFTPSDDGKSLVPVGEAVALSKSSNFYLLLNNLVSAGFPESKLSGDISTLDGLVTYNIGVPEPKRSGLKREEPADGARERVLSVPNRIIKLPWEKKAGGAKGTAKTAPAEEEAGESDEVATEAIKLLEKSMKDGGVKRQELATKILKDYAKNPIRDALATYIFSPEFQAAAMGAGYKVKGEIISKE